MNIYELLGKIGVLQLSCENTFSEIGDIVDKKRSRLTIEYPSDSPFSAIELSILERKLLYLTQDINDYKNLICSIKERNILVSNKIAKYYLRDHGEIFHLTILKNDKVDKSKFLLRYSLDVVSDSESIRPDTVNLSFIIDPSTDNYAILFNNISSEEYNKYISNISNKDIKDISTFLDYISGTICNKLDVSILLKIRDIFDNQLVSSDNEYIVDIDTYDSTTLSDNEFNDLYNMLLGEDIV